MLFEVIASSLDDRARPRGRGCSSGSSPTARRAWHVVVANGDTRAVQGHADAPRVTFRTSWEDFVDMSMGRTEMPKLLLRGRFRPKGDLRWLVGSRGMFPT